MTTLPALHEWTTSRDGMHRATQVVGAFRKAFSPKLPNALHLALYIRPFGLTTGPLPFGAIDFDMAGGEVRLSIGDELLTPRERAVLLHVAGGHRNREIARLLQISEDTVKTHLKHIVDKLGARDRTEAVTIAVRRGFMQL